MDVVLVGYGHIGKKLEPEFTNMARATGGSLDIYDKYLVKYNNPIEAYRNDYDVAFICVDTPSKEDGSCDISSLESAIITWASKCKVLAIKSTVPVGTTDRLNSVYQNIIFSPEFSGCTQHVGKHNYVILGGDTSLCDSVAKLYKAYYPADFEIIYTSARVAEMTKYMINCYLAMKVTFCNEFARACDKASINYNDVRNLFIKDPRVNPSHTFVYEDAPYYDSHCLNKDIPSFIRQFNLDNSLMESVYNINKNIKAKFND